ncbi:hypothetical protein JRI60_25270 [Archangium violaceum]|uniref:hypothetical protein n=1 Tax=Archangium violaceum TaxID=83451 RepID=UPI00194FDBF9|nr:hypothetical protein [Archangium violaceum]QRO02084.1 hypothetical protein JRI60_25270 [Archangium violaceum]
MMLTALTLLLLSAEPGPSQPAPSVSSASLAVVSTSAPGLEKLASDAGRTLGTRLEAPFVDLGGYLKSRGEGCQRDPRCLVAAPGLSGTSRVLHLRLRPLSAGRVAADLRLIELRTWKVIGRSASVVETGELATWAETSSSRLLKRADPYARNPPQSPFSVKHPSETPPATTRPAPEAK